MATIKSFTSLEQSRKLVEILPLESADMFWLVVGNKPRIHVLTEPLSNYSKWENYHSWSLAALLCCLPFPVLYMEMVAGMIFWCCECHFIETDEVVRIEHHDNPVDACVAMVEKLKELNLL